MCMNIRTRYHFKEVSLCTPETRVTIPSRPARQKSGTASCHLPSLHQVPIIPSPGRSGWRGLKGFSSRDRLLPGCDPLGRQAFISSGAFPENLDIAAGSRGYRADLDLFPGGWPDPMTVPDTSIARIDLVRDSRCIPDPLSTGSRSGIRTGGDSAHGRSLSIPRGRSRNHTSTLGNVAKSGY